MRFYLQTARWCCRHCGNIQTTTNEPNTLIKHPGFCSCKFRDWELDLKNSDLVEEDEKIESPLFQQGKLNIFVDYVKLAEMFQEKAPFFYDKSRIWWIWEEETKSWKINDETDIINSMNSTVNGLFLFKQQTKTEIINALKMQGRKKTPETIPKTWVQFLDKITDVKTGKMFEANSKYFITNPLPWKIGETEETPVIDKLFHDWVEEKYIPTLYEILAFSILPDYPLHRVFCLNGSGRNGKGSFLNILTKFIGNENICSTDFDLLTSGRFESAKLYKKLVCLMGEINSSIFKRTALFKKLTGGDMIGFELKGRDSFDDFNYAKLIIATNKLPEPADKTIGFFSRWLIIDFNNIFEEKSGLIETIPEKEFENLAKKSIRILSELLEKNKFSNDGNYEDREQRYEERSSPLREFLKERCEKEQNVEILFWDLKEEYFAYLAARNFRKATEREFANLIKNAGFVIKKVHFTKEDGARSTHYIVYGIKIKDQITEIDEEVEKNLQEIEKKAGNPEKPITHYL